MSFELDTPNGMKVVEDRDQAVEIVETALLHDGHTLTHAHTRTHTYTQCYSMSDVAYV